MKRRSKILWLDTETTGLDPKLNDIWQLAYLIEIDGEVKEEGEMMIRPSNMDTVEDDALKIGGVTREELESLDYTIADAVEDLKDVFGKYVDKYDRKDKFVVAGYFVRFDIDFLREMFFKSGDRYGIGSWCFTCLLDVPSFVAIGVAKYGMRFQNFKLETVCKKLGVEFKAHDALEDIKATRVLYEALGGLR